MGRDKNENIINEKDSNVVFNEGNVKSSEINNEQDLSLTFPPEQIEEYLATTDKYTDGEDILTANLPVRHPNRNIPNGENNIKGKGKRQGNHKNDNHITEVNHVEIVAEELPGVLTREGFTELANFKAAYTVSLYIRTNHNDVEGNEHFDKIGFKSILNTVEQQMKEKGHNMATIENLLKPGYNLVNENDFWANQTEGLAVFIAEGFFKYIKMPVAPLQQVVIESTFYVTPLVPIITRNEYFYLLIISKSQLKLFKADTFGIQPVHVDVPGEVGEVKRLSDLDATTYRTGSAGKRATPVAETAAYHGHGGGNPDEKEILATYFEYVDDILFKAIFNKENAPLLLAGVEYLIPIYKSVCDYHNVWDKYLTGSRERQDSKTLYQDAKELMEPYFLQGQTKALELYGNKSATALTSSIVNDVIPAAYYGRIAQLFVCNDCHVWGTFDEMSNELVIHESQIKESEDLIDNAVVKTLATGGEVFLLEKERMPADCHIAAIMRY